MWCKIALFCFKIALLHNASIMSGALSVVSVCHLYAPDYASMECHLIPSNTVQFAGISLKFSKTEMF